MELLPDFFVDINSIKFRVNNFERFTVGIGEVVTITATVKNNGTTDAEGTLVRFFIDINQDGIVDSGELIDEGATSTIAADGGVGDASVIWIPTEDDEGSSRWIRITVDPYDTVLELNEGDDNRAIITLDIVIPPDLSITNDDIIFKNSAGRVVNNATEGETVTIELSITNLGSNPATNIFVGAYNGWPDANYDGEPDDPLPPGVELIDSANVISMTPGTHSVPLEWDTTDKEGDHFIYVFITDDTLINGYPIKDQILQNNHAEKDFIVHAKPDLYVTIPSPFTTNVSLLNPEDMNVITSNPEIGQNVILRTTIFNFGQVYLSDVMISFYDGDPATGGILLGNDTVDLGPTSPANASIEWTVNAPIGVRKLFVWVNSDQSVLESDIDNNIVSDTFNVEFAEYYVIFTVQPPSTIDAGKAIEIRAEAKFTGTDLPLTGMTYNVTILNANTLEQYGDTITGKTHEASGIIWTEIAAPDSAGDYKVRVEVSYGMGSRYAEADISVEEEEQPLIPLWLLLLVILIAVVIVLVVGVALAKFGLGKLVECGECGAFIPEGEKACPKCGAVFETDTAKCSECGAWIPVESKSCPDCGAIFAGLEKEKKDYIERMKVQYQEYMDQYKGEARSDLGKEPTDEEFNDWWKANPKYVGFEEWLAREEELRKGRTKNCPSCNSINPESAAICYKCGTVFKEEEEEEEEEMPPPEVPAKRVARPEERRAPAAPQTVVPKKVTRPPETVPRKVVKAPPTVVPKKVVRPPEEGKTVVVPKKVVKRPPPEEE
jgi:RNA polymerase subunit RPABC4/transcription elongation factor Spt4